MDIDNIISYALTALGSGGVLSFLTYRFTVKEAEATAMEKVQNVYQRLTEDLVKEIDRLKNEVELLRQEVNTLSRRSANACYRHDCRIRVYEETERTEKLLEYEEKH